MCTYCEDDYEDMEFCAVKLVTARKPHRCYECGEPISAGAQYERVSGKCEGEVFTMHVCADCLRLRRMVLETETGKKNLPFGILHDIAAEHGVLDAWEEWKRARDEFRAHPSLPVLEAA